MRVAITGVGVVSCLGNDLDTVSAALRAGRSGIVVDPERTELGFYSPLTGAIRDYDVRAYVNRKQARSMGQPAQFSVGAAVEALRHAGLEQDALRSDRAGVIVGNDSCAQPAVEAADLLREKKQTRLLGSGRILQVMNSTVTINLGTFFGVRGASWTVSGACASGAHAVGQALMLIKSGLQDIILCGGAQELNWESMAAFDAIGAFARYVAEDGDDPTRCCRPFDVARTGLVPSGGAAMLVVEAWDAALARGANILAEVIGYAFSSDGTHVTQPGGHGAVRAMRECLRQAQIDPGAVDYVSAHATGTPVGDVVEGKAVLEVFAGAFGDGKGSPPMSSTKSMTGHECWMAGASELVYSILMMRDGFIAPNINLTEPEPSLQKLDLVRETRDVRPRTILSNSFGFGGTNAALLLASADD